MTEATLIEQCILNKEKAVRTFFGKYAPFIMSVARRYVYSNFDADDILQEAFIKILKNLSSYDSSKGEFRSWIARIVINEALMHLRRQKRMQSLFEEVDDDIQISEMNAGYEHLKTQDLYDLLDSLPEGKRLIFTLYAIDGLKHNEIAEQLNISEGTSKSQYAKAKQMLQEKIERI